MAIFLQVHLLIILLFITLFFAFTYKTLIGWFRTVILALKLKGPKPLPLVGNAFLIQDSKELEKIASYCYQKYGPVFRAWISFIPAIFIFQPQHLQVVLGSKKLIEKNFLYSFMHNFIGEGLITNNGNKWKSHRKYIQPYFNLNFLDKNVEVFEKHAKIFVKKLNCCSTVKITNYVNDCIIDILHEAVFDLQKDDKMFKNISPFRRGKLMVNERLTKPWMLFDFLYKFSSYKNLEITQKSKLFSFSKKVLEKHKTNEKNDDKSLLDILLQISKIHSDFNEDDVINECCTFMLAGQDSVASAISFTIHYLAKHKQCQEKAREEVMNVFEKSQKLNVFTLNSMKYLGFCIKEALRLCPSVPIIARKLTEDLVLIPDNLTLPKGCNVFITPFVTHRLPYLYPNPEKYDPDRFTKEKEQNRHPYSFIPFSAGPRNCLGYKFAMLEMKTVMAYLLKNYQMNLENLNGKLDLKYRITLRAKGGVWVNLIKID